MLQIIQLKCYNIFFIKISLSPLTNIIPRFVHISIEIYININTSFME